MISEEKINGFITTKDSSAPKSTSERTARRARGIAESPETLKAFLESKSVPVKIIKDRNGDGKVLVLDGCPMNPDHGQGSDTAVIWRPDGVIGFECKHDSCAGHTWTDVRRKIDPEYAQAAEWEPPIPLGDFVLPDFPLEAFPGELCALCEFCAAVAESYEVPPDLPAMLSLAVGGAALAKRVVVHVRGDHRESVNLFVAVAMEPATRKSNVFREICQPLAQFEIDEANQLAPQIEENRVRRATLEMALKHAQQLAARATTADKRQEARQRIENLQQELRDTPLIIATRYVADDATPESLATLLRDHGGRIALLSPEGDTFDLMAGRYSSSGTPNLGVYLKGHAGDDLRVDRVSKDRPAEFVQQPALTIGLAIQPDVLRGLMSKPGFKGRGLLGRFLYSIPPTLLGHRQFNGQPVPPHIREGYDRLIKTALRLSPDTDEQNNPTPHIIRVGADALHQLKDLERLLEVELGDGGKLAAMRDWAGKHIGAICRIAGVFHGLIHAGTGKPAMTPISVETMLGAMAIGEYLVQHARAAYFEMGSDPTIDAAKRILRWIEAELHKRFSRRDAFNALRSGLFNRVDQLDQPLELLESHGYIRRVDRQHSGPGRKPSPQYEVNPLFLAQNTQNAQNRAET